ncbi:MAG: LytTR family transcriptional regulator DNA-binding domain-containing protein [Anaerovoracaceae bacterium]|jgi:DNA-binding LytR/AlgR family response regulator
MNTEQLDQIAIQIVKTYYNNDLRLFFHYMDKDILWVGPRQGQVMQGKAALQKAWSQEHSDLTFEVSDIRIISEQLDYKVLAQTLFYEVATHFPDGTIHTHDQRFLFIWKEHQIKRETVPRIIIMHISNAAQKNQSDRIYAVHDHGMDSDALRVFSSPFANDIVFIRTSRSGTTYLPTSSIFWIEASDKGKHCVFHTKDGSISCIDALSTVAGETEGIFLRSHSSYLVNPLYVKKLQRFTVTLRDGAVLPVPEKKYTAFRSALSVWHARIRKAKAAFMQEVISDDAEV